MFKQENVVSGVHVRIADSLRRTVWRESGGAGVRRTALLTRQVGPPFPGRDAGHPVAPGLGARLRGARGLLRPRTFTTFVIPGLGKPASSLTATVSTECESLKRWNTLPWSAGPRLGISAAHDIAGGFLRLLGRHSHYKHFAFSPYLLLREIFAFNSRTL